MQIEKLQINHFKIIDKAKDFVFFYDADTETVFISTRPPARDGKELVAVTLLADYLKILKD